MRGFTLIEVMMSIMIVGVLAGLAAPSFREMSHANHLAGIANEFVTALAMTRSEAVKRGNPVTVCRTNNPNDALPVCATGAGWETGWVVFSDPANFGALNAGETIISVRSGLPNDLRLRKATGGAADLDDLVTFSSAGTPTMPSNGTLRLCRSGFTVARQIVISMTGRPRVEKVTVASCP